MGTPIVFCIAHEVINIHYTLMEGFLWTSCSRINIISRKSDQLCLFDSSTKSGWVIF